MMLPPLSLYVHIPWCVRKCPYCDFNSHEAAQIPEDTYVDALVADLQEDLHLVQGRRLVSIFFGGGTPSLFRAFSIARIIEEAERRIGFADRVEITLETNPGTAEYHNLFGYNTAGVNRISFGVQSFNDLHLHALGRIHNSGEAVQAIGQARKAGFDNINLDLMHGLPGQSVQEAMADLTRAIDQQPEHISWYQLTIEPNTVFYSRPPALPEDEVLADIQAAGQQLLEDAGFYQYEVSAYARSDRRSEHNLNYWQFGDYLGIGAGAHGKISNPNTGITRYRKTRKPADYLDSSKSFAAGREIINLKQQPVEFMMNALRLVDGVPRSFFTERTQLPDSALDRYLSPLIVKGLLCAAPDRLQTSPLGMRFLNDVLAAFADQG